MQYPNFNEERKLQGRGFGNVAGLDEAGRGPLAGPVVAAAVIVRSKRSEIFKIGVRDSKKLSARQRDKLFSILTSHSQVSWGVGIVSEKVIDKINILQATKLAMQKAVDVLKKKISKVDFLILDGNFSIVSPIPQRSIIKADIKVFSCAAASVIAKVTRDRIMIKYDKKYPGYGFAKHKGYPTLKHREAIKRIGPCHIHRKSFFGVKEKP
ncbi:MAG: ribonuclease HII [Candidatus Staskawiczbacteria bacterium]|jgi:ribonuclease HII